MTAEKPRYVSVACAAVAALVVGAGLYGHGHWFQHPSQTDAEVLRLAGLIHDVQQTKAAAGVVDPQEFGRKFAQMQEIVGSSVPDVVARALLEQRGQGVVVDVGASDGSFLTLPSLNAGRIVYSIEPDNRAVQQLFAKAAAGRYLNKKLRVLSHTAGSEERVYSLTFVKANTGISCLGCASMDTETTYQAKVRVRPVDNIVPEQVHMLKVQAPGYELEVLNGAKRAFDLQGVRHVILTFNASYLEKKSRDPKAIFDFLFERNYVCLSMARRGADGQLIRDSHPLNKETADEYLKHMTATESPSNLFCMRGIV